MAGMERAEERLENIESVEPILSALRTVSQASMQTARRKAEGALRYGRDLLDLASWLPEEPPDRVLGEGEEDRTLLVVLGSDRGLCGTFNHDVVEVLAEQFAEEEGRGRRVEIWARGLRLRIALAERDITPDRGERFAEGSVPDFQHAYTLAEEIQSGVREDRFNRVLIVINRQVRADRIRPTVEQLLPLELANFQGQGEKDRWPPPILETDPEGLRERIRRQALEVNLYRLLLRSSAAEHAARFYLLEDAAQNMDRLTEELEMEVQLSRQQAITNEMMDLIVAAGLIKS